MTNTHERQRRQRVAKGIHDAVREAFDFEPLDADEWIADLMGAPTKWSVRRWREGAAMPTTERWDALESMWTQLKSGTKVEDLKVQKVKRSNRGGSPKRAKSKSPRAAKAAATTVKHTMHSASVELIRVVVDTMTLTELDDLHRMTGEKIVEKARR